MLSARVRRLSPVRRALSRVLKYRVCCRRFVLPHILPNVEMSAMKQNASGEIGVRARAFTLFATSAYMPPVSFRVTVYARTRPARVSFSVSGNTREFRPDANE